MATRRCRPLHETLPPPRPEVQPDARRRSIVRASRVAYASGCKRRSRALRHDTAWNTHPATPPSSGPPHSEHDRAGATPRFAAARANGAFLGETSCETTRRKGDQKLERAALKHLAPLQGGSEPAQMPGSAALHPGSLEVGAQYRSQYRHVFDDRPASFQRVGRAVVPTCIGAEHEERIPDELTGRAVGVGEGLADALIVVPVMDRAPVDEQVGDVEAGVERHHGEPDDVDTKVGIWISLEDLRLHRTGAALADGSGWRQQQEQSWLSAVRVEGGLQRVDALQFGDLPRLRGTARRLLRSGASGEQERGEGRYDKPCPHRLEGIGVNSDRLPSFPGRRRVEVERTRPAPSPPRRR